MEHKTHMTRDEFRRTSLTSFESRVSYIYPSLIYGKRNHLFIGISYVLNVTLDERYVKKTKNGTNENRGTFGTELSSVSGEKKNLSLPQHLVT